MVWYNKTALILSAIGAINWGLAELGSTPYLSNVVSATLIIVLSNRIQTLLNIF